MYPKKAMLVMMNVDLKDPLGGDCLTKGLA